MKRLLVILTVVFAGCASLQTDPSIHYDSDVFKKGVTRNEVMEKMGEPNQTIKRDDQLIDVYAFEPDGTKFVNPTFGARDVIFTIGTIGIYSIVRAFSIANASSDLVLYRLFYGPGAKIESVEEVQHQSGWPAS